MRLLLLSLLIIFPFSVFAQTTRTTSGQITFTTPGAPWNVLFDAKNFTLAEQKVKSDGRSGYFLMNNDVEHYTVSLWIEPVDKCSDSKACRDHVLSLGNPRWGKFEKLVKSEIGEISYFEFYRPVVDNQPVKMLDMYAEFVKEGFWIDLHITKVLYTEKDHALFENFVRSAKFEFKNRQLIAQAKKWLE